MITIFSIYFTFVAGNCPSSFDFKDITYIGNQAFENCADTIGHNLVIPATVTGIGYHSFYRCTGITGKLTINANCNQIQNGAFDGCSGITELSFNEKIMSLEADSFRYCSSLTKVTFPNSLRGIGNGAFYQCTELSINIFSYAELFDIGSFAFYNCSKISLINFITQFPINIGSHSFANCKGLNSLTLPSNIEQIGHYAFANCTNLQTINIQDCPSFAGIGVFERCSGLRGTIKIPSRWTTVSENTFAYCTGITGLTLHENLKTIEPRAFYKCSQLSGRLVILNSEMSIGKEAFYECSSLQQLTNLNQIKEIDSASFAHCSFLNSVLNFNNNIRQIPPYLFYGCSSLVGPLTISSSISDIYEYAFYNCSQLTIDNNFDLSNLNYIYDYSFYNCQSINGELILSDQISEIGNYAFYNCSQLTGELKINVTDYYWEENSVKIGEYAFYGCSGFEGDFIINSCIGSIGKEAFGSTNFDQIIYNFVSGPFCSDSIGENIDIYVPVDYKPDSFCKNKFIRDIPYIRLFDMDDHDVFNGNYVLVDIYGLYDYKEFYINYFNEIFASQNNENETYINYFTYETNSERSLIFNNEMKPNQYFQLYYEHGMRVYYYGGQLNLINPADYIAATDIYDFNISIMGTGYLIFEQKYNPGADYSKKYHINIFSNSTFIDSFQFKLQDTHYEVESISIEDVTLVENGNILPVEYKEFGRENVVAPKLEIKKLTVEPYTKAKIDAAKITGPFIIRHNSKITLLDVDLTEAEMIYEMGPHINKNNVFTGSINSKPKSFTIVEPENPKRNFTKEYILMDANFDCLNWNISIAPNSKYLEKYECVEIKSSNNHYQLKMITKDDIPPIYDDDFKQDKKEKSKNKLSTGAIVGIVIGCIVVVAALLIAEFFIITRCIRNKDVSKNEGNEEL